MENIEVARTYYSQALKLNPNNLRALYGLYLVSFFLKNKLQNIVILIKLEFLIT